MRCRRGNFQKSDCELVIDIPVDIGVKLLLLVDTRTACSLRKSSVLKSETRCEISLG